MIGIEINLKIKLPEVIQKCEQVVGVHASEWKVKNMRTKWGNLQYRPKKNLDQSPACEKNLLSVLSMS
mgnify:CR=1 FL=1